MTNKEKVDKFIKSQLTFTAQGPEYKKTKRALRGVLLALPDKDYNIVTKNLIFSVLHERPYGQLMHMKPVKGKFKIMQLTVPKNIPIEFLRWVIAHELGHVMQGRNWRKGDGERLEVDADKRAKEWGLKVKLYEHYDMDGWINVCNYLFEETGEDVDKKHLEKYPNKGIIYPNFGAIEEYDKGVEGIIRIGPLGRVATPCGSAYLNGIKMCVESKEKLEELAKKSDLKVKFSHLSLGMGVAEKRYIFEKREK